MSMVNELVPRNTSVNIKTNYCNVCKFCNKKVYKGIKCINCLKWTHSTCTYVSTEKLSNCNGWNCNECKLVLKVEECKARLASKDVIISKLNTDISVLKTECDRLGGQLESGKKNDIKVHDSNVEANLKKVQNELQSKIKCKKFIFVSGKEITSKFPYVITKKFVLPKKNESDLGDSNSPSSFNPKIFDVKSLKFDSYQVYCGDSPNLANAFKDEEINNRVEEVDGKRRGGKVIHDGNGHFYTIQTKGPHTMYLRCAAQGCGVRASARTAINERFAVNITSGEHNHGPNHTRIALQQLRSRLLQRSEKESTQLQQIYREETAKAPKNIVALLPFISYRRTMSRARAAVNLKNNIISDDVNSMLECQLKEGKDKVKRKGTRRRLKGKRNIKVSDVVTGEQEVRGAVTEEQYVRNDAVEEKYVEEAIRDQEIEDNDVVLEQEVSGAVTEEQYVRNVAVEEKYVVEAIGDQEIEDNDVVVEQEVSDAVTEEQFVRNDTVIEEKYVEEAIWDQEMEDNDVVVSSELEVNS